MLLRLAREEDVPRIPECQSLNEAHLAPWSPTRPPGFLTPGYWRERVREAEAEWAAGTGLGLFLFERAQPEAVIGTAGLSQIARGAFQACYLGYGIGRAHEGRGLMSEALRLLIAHAFGPMNLHRIMANYMPRNTRSAALLARLGFEIEGEARAYLRIAGRWEDHVLTALTNPAWKAPAP